MGPAPDIRVDLCAVLDGCIAISGISDSGQAVIAVPVIFALLGEGSFWMFSQSRMGLDGCLVKTGYPEVRKMSVFIHDFVHRLTL